jgi:hypothetical protein
MHRSLEKPGKLRAVFVRDDPYPQLSQTTWAVLLILRRLHRMLQKRQVELRSSSSPIPCVETWKSKNQREGSKFFQNSKEKVSRSCCSGKLWFVAARSPPHKVELVLKWESRRLTVILHCLDIILFCVMTNSIRLRSIMSVRSIRRWRSAKSSINASRLRGRRTRRDPLGKVFQGTQFCHAQFCHGPIWFTRLFSNVWRLISGFFWMFLSLQWTWLLSSAPLES